MSAGFIALALMSLTACTGKKQAADAFATNEARHIENSGKVTIAAAASLETCLTKELIPLFHKKYPNITIEGTYDSSGKLQTQIQEGAPVDLFISASTKQMDALQDKGLLEEKTYVNLLENRIVLIVPAKEEEGFTAFEDIKKAETVALGDPDSVPVGQYSREVLENLGLWEEISEKTSFGTNVTEVLNWVAEGSAKAGIVYATDAAQKPDKVTVVAEAPKGSVKKAIYPIGIIKDCENPDTAVLFSEFLKSEEARKIFEANGFLAVK